MRTVDVDRERLKKKDGGTGLGTVIRSSTNCRIDIHKSVLDACLPKISGDRDLCCTKGKHENIKEYLSFYSSPLEIYTENSFNDLKKKGKEKTCKMSTVIKQKIKKIIEQRRRKKRVKISVIHLPSRKIFWKLCPFVSMLLVKGQEKINFLRGKSSFLKIWIKILCPTTTTLTSIPPRNMFCHFRPRHVGIRSNHFHQQQVLLQTSWLKKR